MVPQKYSWNCVRSGDGGIKGTFVESGSGRDIRQSQEPLRYGPHVGAEAATAKNTAFAKGTVSVGRGLDGVRENEGSVLTCVGNSSLRVIW